MARGGPPEDDLAVIVRRGRPSKRRSWGLAVALAAAVLVAAAPGGRPPTDEGRLEVGAGPSPAPSGRSLDAVVTGVSAVEEPDVTTSTSVASVAADPSSSSSSTLASGSRSGWGSAPAGSSAATPMTLAMMTAEALAPVRALSDSGSGAPLGTGGTTSPPSTSGPSTVPPPTFAPTTVPRATTGTTRPPAANAPATTKPPAVTTTRPPTTTTTTRPPTTTTTRPTTTTQPPPCTWSGRVQVERSGFVFDGQSNALAPEWRQSFPVKLMQARFPGRPAKISAVGGTSYPTRTDWAPEKTDVHVGQAACAVLISHGGESDLREGATARDLGERIKVYVAGRRAAGFDVVVVPTIPPSRLFTAQQDAERLAFNEGMRRGHRNIGVDVLVDVAARPELQDWADARYFVDGIHYTDAGATVVADAYSRALP